MGGVLKEEQGYLLDTLKKDSNYNDF